MTRVLVIDDEAPIRLLCRVNLEAEKMEVREASDGPTGLEKARTEEPDLIRLGGIDYVTKPFNPTELAPLVRELVQRVDQGEREEVRREKIAELRDLIEPN